MKFVKEKMMKQSITLKLTVLGLFALLLGLPAAASAQGRNNRRDNNSCDDRNNNGNNRNGNNRNGGYDNRNGGSNNGGYNNANYDYTQLRGSVQRLKDLSKDFERDLGRALDNSRYNGSDQEDQINETAKDFRNAASRLQDRSNDGRDINRSSNEASEVIRLGAELDQFLARNRFDRQTQNEWSNLSQELEVVADAYGYDFYASNGNGGYNNGRNNGNSRNTNNNNRNNGNNNGNNGRWRNLPNVVSNGRWPF